MQKITLSLLVAMTCLVSQPTTGKPSIENTVKQLIAGADKTTKLGARAQELKSNVIYLHDGNARKNNQTWAQCYSWVPYSWVNRPRVLKKLRVQIAAFERELVSAIKGWQTSRDMHVSVANSLGYYLSLLEMMDIRVNSDKFIQLNPQSASVLGQLRGDETFEELVALLIKTLPLQVELITPGHYLAEYFTLKVWQLEQEQHMWSPNYIPLTRGLSEVIHAIFGKQSPTFKDTLWQDLGKAMRNYQVPIDV